MITQIYTMNQGNELVLADLKLYSAVLHKCQPSDVIHLLDSDISRIIEDYQGRGFKTNFTRTSFKVSRRELDSEGNIIKLFLMAL